MTRNLIILGAMLALAFPAGFWLPWWSIALVTGLVALISKPAPGVALGAGLLAGALVWGGMAAYIDAQNQHILTGRIGLLFQGLPPAGVVALTALIGALPAGMGAWTGALLRRLR